MKQIIKLCLLGILMTMVTESAAQIRDYQFHREITGVSQSWHKIKLLPEVLGSSSANLSDLRIYGIDKKGDTIEVPFLWRQARETTTVKEVFCNLLNTTHNNDGYFFTFEVPSKDPTDKIHLNFKNENFDWTARLEGSHDQSNWFTIIDEYRIVAVNNHEVSFTHTDLNFSRSNYRYMRVRIKSEDPPILESASLSRKEHKDGQLEQYAVVKTAIEENTNAKETRITIRLDQLGRPSLIRLSIEDTVDYYRPVMAAYLADSINTEKGWKHQYVALNTGVLSSMGSHEIILPSAKTQQLQIIIKNHDNRPLRFNEIQVWGYVHELTARFPEESAAYYLAYGNPDARTPHYDITRFQEKIPANTPLLKLGKETTVPHTKSQSSLPLFISQYWLWTILLVIIATMGWFTLQMIRNKEDATADQEI